MNRELTSIQSLQKEFQDDHWLRQSCEIYHYNHVNFQSEDIEVGQSLQKEINKKLKNPALSQSKKSAEGILNYINLLKPMDERTLQPIGRGGFTKIFLTCVKFELTGSQSDDGEPADENPYKRSEPQEKWVVLKREEAVTGSRSRNQHEIEVLKRIKNGVSPLLPHYYIQHGKKDLFLDYVRYPTLHDYTRLYKNTLSFKTKLHIGFLVAQALRHLDRYSILHLDIKPSNLMMSPPHLKIIDFGESYHPFLEKDPQYRPGFTYPYSAPENYHYRGPQLLSTKCDIFSLGVILHELLLTRMPFQLKEEQRDSLYW